MIIKTESTVFNVNADCIVNTINCDGFMGKGLALEFSLRYPKLNEIYSIQAQKKELKPGRVYYYQIDGQKIVNFSTKDHFQNPSQIEWIEFGLFEFINTYKKHSIKSVAFPLLGVSNGGLNKEEVELIMEKYLSQIDIDVYICYGSKVEGKEKEMIDNYSLTNLYSIQKELKLTSKQIDALMKNQYSIKRFYDILSIPSIGKTTYKKLFDYFYNQKKDNEQISLSI